MHCYRCGRRVPDRSPRCENCGQKFSFGQEPAAARNGAPGVVVPAASGSSENAVIPPPPDPSGLSESIFEVSRTSGAEPILLEDRSDPTVSARQALQKAGDAAMVGFGERAIPLTEPTEPEAARAPIVPKPSSFGTQPLELPPGFGVATTGGTSAPSAGASQLLPQDSTASDIVVGKTLSNRLEIVAELGSGPLGRVFKAVDRKKGSVVAVKAIPAARLPEEALSGRFGETINLVKSLVHPNLVKVYGAGREGDTAFTIEQYLEGLPLRALLDVKRENGSSFTFEEAEPIIAQICQGLSFAHASLVHGGIKPENVVLHVDSLKIVDLGTSTLFSPSEWYDLQMRASNGVYIAPEYGDPKGRVDRRADVYSVGAILYEMLTGHAPQGPESVPVSSLNPSVPRAVDRVVAKAMSRAPEGRYVSAAELKEAIFRVLGGDILADDLESPVGEMMETFVDVAEENDGEPGIEIEYVEPGPLKAGDRDSEDPTPVGAIELHEPLWEPDELQARTRSSDFELRSKAAPVSEAPNAGVAAIRDLFPSRGTSGGPRDAGLGHADHVSVDIPAEDGSGGEATAAGMPPEARATSWLDVKGPLGRVDAGTPAAVERRVPDAEAPTTVRPPAIGGDPIRAPSPTPPPWDYRYSGRAGAGAVGERENDRPTEPPRPPLAPPVAASERPTLQRPKTEEDLGARALLPAVSPQLDLSRAADPLDRPTDDRPADRAIPAPQPRVASTPPRRVEFEVPSRPVAPLATPVAAPRPAFVVRRRASGAPRLLVLLVLIVGGLGGGWWFSRNTGSLEGFVPVPRAGRCMEGMVWFAPGTFSLGSEKLDPDRDISEPFVHKVTTEGFCIDRFEFPNKEGEAPRVNVTITQAETLCAKEGKRLCSETEWERACKGPAGTRFPYGDAFQSGLCNVGATDKPATPRPAGTFPACGREDGLRDMSGNVWEITSSPWPDDPTARVIKGGSAKLPAWGARCSYRDSAAAAKPADDVGFRCCATASAAP